MHDLLNYSCDNPAHAAVATAHAHVPLRASILLGPLFSAHLISFSNLIYIYI